MADEAMNTEMQETIPAEQETTQEATEENTAATETQEQSGAEEVSATDGEVSSNDVAAEETPAPFLTIRFNKKDEPLTEEEARDYAQKGKFYHGKLDYIATLSDTTIPELLDKMLNSIDEAKRNELISQFGNDEDTINLYMKAFHDEQKEKYEKAIADRETAEKQSVEDRNARIAEEFVAMQQDFPELKSVNDIPSSVLKAANNNMPLAYAYLLHKHKENQKIAAAQEQSKAAAQTSTGSMSANEGDTKSDAEQRYLKALWGG